MTATALDTAGTDTDTADTDTAALAALRHHIDAEIEKIDAAPRRVVGVRTIPTGGGYGVAYAPAVYEARRVRGRWIWRLVEKELLGHVWGRDNRRREAGVWTEAKADRIALAIAKNRGLPRWDGCHNRPLTPQEVDWFRPV